VSYYEWAKANPESTATYKSIQREIEYEKELIAKYQEHITLARKGIIHEEWIGRWMGKRDIPADEYLNELPMVISVSEKQSAMHTHKLGEAIVKLNNYQPACTQWHGQGEDKLQLAMSERFVPLGIATWDDNNEPDKALHSLRRLGLNVWVANHGYCWIAKVSDHRVSFTRKGYWLTEALLIALMTYIDHQWDSLIAPEKIKASEHARG
jgi:hypothetical protein